jgi:acetyl esterase
MWKATGFAFVALVAGAAGLLHSWTRTPHGRMDLGAALLIRAMPDEASDRTPEARARANEWVERFMGEADPAVSIESESFPGPAGELPLRVYRPPGRGPFPVIVWIHGGGFWMGDDLPMWDGTCSRLARAAEAVVASIGYRLAPEHPFPAAVEDSFEGTRFVAEHAAKWGGDPRRLAVVGASAGGNLAAVMALRARDEGGPHLLYQVLIVPVTTAISDATESRKLFGSGYGLNGIDEMIAAYLPEPPTRRHPWASPLLSERVDGLPPALILTAQFDPLRDEGEQYAQRLQQAGVEVVLQRMDGAIHGFLGSGEDRAASEALVAETLRKALHEGQGGMDASAVVLP